MAKEIKCIVVDDEPLALDLVSGYVERTEGLRHVGKFSSATEAKEFCDEKDVDVAFLDIQMPDMTGIQLANTLTKKCKVVLITAYDTYGVEGFRIGAVDYLMKPVAYDDFMQSVEKIKRQKDADEALAKSVDDLDAHSLLGKLKECLGAEDVQSWNEKTKIVIKSGYKMLQVDLSDVLYIQGMKDYVKIYIHGIPNPVMSIISMKTLERELPPRRFARIHRSYFVQMDKIEMIDHGRVLIEGQYIPISEGYKDDFLNQLAKHAVIAYK